MVGEITRYSLAWHLENHVGRVVIEVEGRRRIRIEYRDAAEFAAVAAVLREAPVVFRDNVLRTGQDLGEDG